MKNNNFFIIIICSIFILGSTGCERTDLQRSSPYDLVKIEPREIEECDDCPLNDCCCAVWLQNSLSSAQLYFCGTSDGNELCSGDATGICDEFSGGGQYLFLNTGTPKRGFCVDPGQGFWVRNLGDNPAYIYITCQDDVTGPQTLTITLQPSEILYIGSNGECEIFECE